jgi:archaellum component FlaF (FlaF/FlaG flagellin family)
VFIDEQAVELAAGSILLDSGMHHLSVVSDYYRNETRTITVPKAQTLALEVSLTNIAPLIHITAPEGAEVLLDGEKVDLPQKAFTIVPGDHTIKFTLGGYEAIKNIQVINGKTYSVVIAFDVDIIETP